MHRARDVAGLRIHGFGSVPDRAATRLIDAESTFRVRPGSDEDGDVLTGTALLALGRHDAVRAAIRQPAAPADLLLLARWLAWTGDLAFITPRWPDVRRAAREMIRDSAGSTTVRHAAAALERTATDAGDPAFAAELRAALRNAPEPASTPAPGPLVDFEQGRLHPAAARLDRDLAAASSAAPTPADDARAIVSLVHGVLGLEPDAVRGRIRFAPRLLPATAAAGFRDLRVADATLSGEIAVEQRWIRISIRQDSGAIPLTALLEPVLARRVSACSVDGQPADLALRPLGGGIIVPVQLVLDDERRLDIEIGD